MPSDETVSSLNAILDAAEKTRKSRLFIFLFIATLLTAAGVAGSIMVGTPFGILIALGVVSLVYRVMDGFVRDKVASQVMPLLAGMAGGFAYAPSGGATRQLQDTGALPGGRVSRSEDMVQGELGGTVFRSWDAEIIRRSGRTFRIVFRGLVVAVHVRQDRDLLLRRPDTVLRSLLEVFRGKELHEESVTWAGTKYELKTEHGLWHMPSLKSRVEDLAAALPPGVTLHAIHQKGREAHICLETGRDMFACGGLFVSRERAARQLDRALEDLRLAPSAAVLWADTEREFGVET